MIRFNDQVPSIYPSASRDFQYLSWLIDVVLNSVKHNVDSLYDLPNTTADARLTELLAMTLGFKVKRNYDQRQLAALVAVLPHILKYKGTNTALRIAGNALIAASGAPGSFVNEGVVDGELRVILPKNLVDISLFTDLLPYILPAGITCRVVKADYSTESVTTDVGYHDTMLAAWIPYLDNGESIGLSRMFEAPGDELTFSNFKSDNTALPNVGLLDNNIIPVVGSDNLFVKPDSHYELEKNDYGETADIADYKTASNNAGETVVIGGKKIRGK